MYILQCTTTTKHLFLFVERFFVWDLSFIEWIHRHQCDFTTYFFIHVWSISHETPVRSVHKYILENVSYTSSNPRIINHHHHQWSQPLFLYASLIKPKKSLSKIKTDTFCHAISLLYVIFPGCFYRFVTHPDYKRIKSKPSQELLFFFFFFGFSSLVWMSGEQSCQRLAPRPPCFP